VNIVTQENGYGLCHVQKKMRFHPEKILTLVLRNDIPSDVWELIFKENPTHGSKYKRKKLLTMDI
jgi:hypothetical protein